MDTKSIFVAIVGQPNVGKSTLLNRLIGEKASIVSPKPQTTRTRITGILTEGAIQYVFIDTPGFHAAKNKLDALMGRTIRESLSEVDAVMMLFEPVEKRTEQEDELMALIAEEKLPALGVVNKADKVSRGEALAALVEGLKETGVFERVLPASALNGEGCPDIMEWLAAHAAESPHFFPDDAFTDIPEKQLVAEIVREKVLLFMRDEIPHGVAVEVERFKERQSGNMVDIDVIIYCEKKSHKGMLIGKDGQMLKKIGTAAREDTERLLGVRVNLQCWVKIKADWRDDENKMRQVGYRR